MVICFFFGEEGFDDTLKLKVNYLNTSTNFPILISSGFSSVKPESYEPFPWQQLDTNPNIVWQDEGSQSISFEIQNGRPLLDATIHAHNGSKHIFADTLEQVLGVYKSDFLNDWQKVEFREDGRLEKPVYYMATSILREDMEVVTAGDYRYFKINTKGQFESLVQSAFGGELSLDVKGYSLEDSLIHLTETRQIPEYILYYDPFAPVYDEPLDLDLLGFSDSTFAAEYLAPDVLPTLTPMAILDGVYNVLGNEAIVVDSAVKILNEKFMFDMAEVKEGSTKHQLNELDKLLAPTGAVIIRNHIFGYQNGWYNISLGFNGEVETEIELEVFRPDHVKYEYYKSKEAFGYKAKYH